MLPRRTRYVPVLAIGMAALASCSSTQVTTRWQDPTTTQIRFTKVLALCITKDPSLRDAAEGELCQHMPLVKCKPAHLAIPMVRAATRKPESYSIGKVVGLEPEGNITIRLQGG